MQRLSHKLKQVVENKNTRITTAMASVQLSAACFLLVYACRGGHFDFDRSVFDTVLDSL
jgi:hypothetical protein